MTKHIRPRRRSLLFGAPLAGIGLLGTGCGARRQSARPDDAMACIPAADIPTELDPIAAGQTEYTDALSEEIRVSSSALAVSPDGRAVVGSASADRQRLGLADSSGTVIWDAASGRIGRRLGNGLQGAVAFHPSGEFFAAGGGTYIDLLTVDGNILWRLQGHGLPDAMSGQRALITALAFTRDGSRLASLGADGTERHASHAVGDEPRVMAVDDTGTAVGIVGANVSIAVWDRRSDQMQPTPSAGGFIGSFAWSPTSGSLYSAVATEGVLVWGGGERWTPLEVP